MFNKVYSFGEHISLCIHRIETLIPISGNLWRYVLFSFSTYVYPLCSTKTRIQKYSLINKAKHCVVYYCISKLQNNAMQEIHVTSPEMNSLFIIYARGRMLWSNIHALPLLLTKVLSSVGCNLFYLVLLYF